MACSRSSASPRSERRRGGSATTTSSSPACGPASPRPHCAALRARRTTLPGRGRHSSRAGSPANSRRQARAAAPASWPSRSSSSTAPRRTTRYMRSESTPRSLRRIVRPVRAFASDNYAPILPEALAAIAAANEGHVVSYGADPVTARLRELIRAELGGDAFPVFNGTGANVVSLRAMLRPWQGVICADTAHLNVDECGAPEALGGVKLLTVPTPDGKLTPELMERRIVRVGDEHVVQAGAVSITQSTELGTLYAREEVAAIVECARAPPARRGRAAGRGGRAGGGAAGAAGGAGGAAPAGGGRGRRPRGPAPGPPPRAPLPLRRRAAHPGAQADPAPAPGAPPAAG